MNGWLLLPSALVAIWILLGCINIVFNCIQYWHAAVSREDAQAARERGD